MKIADSTNIQNKWVVYAHISPNNKLYIGITSRKPQYRWLSSGNGYKKCQLFWRAIQKYGWDNFRHIILLEHLSKDAACECEKFLIAKYHTNNPDFGYNNSAGGDSGSFGHKMTAEQKRKISESSKGKTLSAKTRKKIGDANRIALKGRTIPDEVRRKMSEHNARPFLGKHHTDEAKRKNAEAHYGKKYHLGYKHTEEAKRKISDAKRGKPLSEAQKAQLQRLHESNRGRKRVVVCSD